MKSALATIHVDEQSVVHQVINFYKQDFNYGDALLFYSK